MSKAAEKRGNPEFLPLNFLLTICASRGSDLIQESGKITWIDYCRALQPYDFSYLREASALISKTLQCYDAAEKLGLLAKPMTRPEFEALTSRIGGA